MYRQFYKLHEKPFDLTPSPRFLYLGESHKEALALLTYGVVERKGFILLTGEVGTGKTTMVHALLSNLDESVRYISISNPLLSPEDFMEYLAFSTFEKKAHFKSKTAFLFEFESFLRQCLQRQNNVILLIDEAHRLSFDLLEEIRLLSNMEMADEKLINIFLIGQPELNEKLSDPRCRPLLQRISSRYHIRPLDLEDTGAYIANRMKIAGSSDWDDIFPKSTVKAIHEYSGGYPRMINILADNALLLGYSKEKRKITPEIIKQCFDDLSLEGSFIQEAQQKTEASEGMTHPSGSTKNESGHLGRYWKWVIVLFLVIVILIFSFNRIGRKSDSTPTHGPEPVGDSPEKRNLEKKQQALREMEQALARKEQALVNKEKSLVEKEHSLSQKKEDLLSQNRPQRDQREEGRLSVHDPVSKPEAPNLEKSIAGQDKKLTFKTLIVERGDTLAQLAANVYGRVNDRILKMIKENNPAITNINRIDIGQKILFPTFSPMDQTSTFTVHIASFKPFENARDLFKDLLAQGYDAYIVPAHNTQKGKVFRVTIGNFETRGEAAAYAAEILNKGISHYADPIWLEMR